MHEDVDPQLGTVARVYRYPVKSLAGETLEAVEVDERGLRGDRLWAVRDPDGKLGSGKSSRRFRRMPGLLDLTAAYPDGASGPTGEAPTPGAPLLGFPDGRTLRAGDPESDEALSGHVGRPVALAREAEVSHFDDGPVHLVTTASLRAVAEHLGEPVDARRFRPNLVIDTGERAGMVEDGWIGHRLRVGEVVLEVVSPMPRCVMVNLPQIGLGPSRVLDAVTDLNGANLGVLATVVTPGRLHVGDPVLSGS